jgi:hypothetical protein
MANEQIVTIPGSAGLGEGWEGDLPLDSDYPDSILLDLSDLTFVRPLLLLRLRTFVDWHLEKGRKVRVELPKSNDVRRYMARMHIHHGLASDVFAGMPTVQEHDRSESLVPVSIVRGGHEADHLCDGLVPILEEFADDASLPQAVNMAMSELTNNAVEHGQNEFGTYIAVQRYPKLGSLIIATSDLGVGIPEHLRQQHPEWDDDGYVIEMALRSGVSGTGDPHRGFGLAYTLETIEASEILKARFTIRSGRGECVIETPKAGKSQISRSATAYKRGTMVNLVLTNLSNKDLTEAIAD